MTKLPEADDLVKRPCLGVVQAAASRMISGLKNELDRIGHNGTVLVTVMPPLGQLLTHAFVVELRPDREKDDYSRGIHDATLGPCEGFEIEVWGRVATTVRKVDRHGPPELIRTGTKP